MPARMKAMIAETFLTMAKERNIDKITVKDLVETCHISRQTFYYHFQDMLDVIVWSVDQTLRKVLAQGMREETLTDSLRVFVTFTIESSSLLCRLLRSQYRERMEFLIVQSIQDYLRAMVHRQAARLSIPQEDLDLSLRFTSFGIVGVLLENCERPYASDQHLAEQLCRLISGQMRNPILEG